jgi:hypothetical protein
MKESFCFFLPANVEAVEGFITLMSLAGSYFDKDYTVTPIIAQESFVKIEVASHEQYNIARVAASQVIMKDLQ